MHEAHWVRNLVAQVEALARSSAASRVLAVKVWLGALSHCAPEHFREHFEQESRGTLAEGAELRFEQSEDLGDPRAADIVLLDVEVEVPDDA